MWPFKKSDKEIRDQKIADKINQLNIEMGRRGRVVYKGNNVKRDPEKYANVVHETIYRYYGLFAWQECLFCDKEFRREGSFRFQLQVNRDWIYSCAECCPTKADVNTKVGELKSNRPKAPAAPPRKR